MMPRGTYTVRKARLEDAQALTRVLRSVEHFARLIAMPEAELTARVERLLAQCLADDSHLVLAAQDEDGDVAGYVAVHWLPYLILSGPEGYISELFVHQRARGDGVGTCLLAAVKEEARKRGCARLSLLNGRTRPSYQREFYRKDGWQERETMANFIFELD